MLLLLAITSILLLGFLVTSLSGAPWVPARKYDLEALLDDAQLKKGDNFIELGCGDGRLVVAAARRGAKATGYELNPLLWFIAWIRCFGQKNAQVRFGNLWSVDLSHADVVMAFLVPRTMPRLAIKAAREMKPSARLVSYIFPIVGKKPELHNRSWYIYRFKTVAAQKQ